MSEIIPVIHVVSREQTLMNLGMCIASELRKVFLINHQVSREFMLDLAREAKELLPNMWVGVNMLGTTVEEALNMDLPVDAIWCDQTVKSSERKFKGEVFGGLAFKYQAQPKDIAEACNEAIQCTTVATTSGPGTGKAASYDKIKHLRDCLGNHPLALASGVNPINIKMFAPYVNYMLVATSITNSDETLNPNKLKEVLAALAAIQPRHG
jgi:hypothetical protein